MIDKEKINKIEDPEIRELATRISEFVYPKFTELRDMISGGEGEKKPSFIKMMKVLKDFSTNLEKEYKEKYDKDLNADIKKMNEYLGIDPNPMNLINMLKNI